MAFSLSGLTQKLSSALGTGGESSGSVLGIDIGASSAKVVQLRASRGAA